MDATPLFTGYTPGITSAPHFTTNEIVEELGEQERLRLSVGRDWLHVREPSPGSLRQVVKAASETGDLAVLSSADLSILALGLDLSTENEVRLLTDDYAIQNVASKLGLAYQSYVWRGIKRTLVWESYCPNCRKTYNTQVQTCPTCGAALRRRAAQAGRRKRHVES